MHVAKALRLKDWIRICVLGAVGSLSAMSPQRGGEAPAVAVSLPTMVVAALSDEQPWQYVHVDGCEVLTLCDAVRTSRFMAAIRRSTLFVPQDFQTHASRQIRCIIFDQFLGQVAPQPAGVRKLSQHEFGEGWHRLTNVVAENSGMIVANLHGMDAGGWPELWISCLEPHFANMRPRPPDWLTEGLLGTHGALGSLGSYDKSRRLTRLAAFAWDQMEEVRAVVKHDADGHGLYPLVELFESPPPKGPELSRRWALQAALFCRWQIYSAEGQRNGGHGFWNWARLARKGPVDEEMFRHCMGLDYAAAETQMLRYLKRFLGVSHDMPIRLYPLTEKSELRPATALEIARMLGEYQWHEARRLREEGKWERASKYESAARQTYARGLSRTNGQAQLHAGLGLLEYEGGCADEARGHLEKAFAGKGAEGRALLALAQLRLTETRAAASSAGRLDAAQVGFVLDPLFAARAVVPVAVDVYRLIGGTWELSAVVPEARHLNILLEGVRDHPHDLELAAQVAGLHARFGHRDIARAVARRGARLAGRSSFKERFEEILVGLGPP